MRLLMPAILSASLLLAGCSHAAEREDLARYDAAGAEIERMERATLQAMRNAHHEGATDAQKLKLFKEQLLPLATRYAKTVDALAPATPAVAELHALKLEAARLQQQAIADFATALERQDGALARAAGQKFVAYRDKLGEFADRHGKLAKRIGG